ncbi:hypothetical protein V7S43_014529 [Phytophthora oleae]|uniref:Uncharacterized protein n=1 Tax=Phytophthora oleae TaxID=2107226 RepID=A0ABD3F1T7_9STRA
MPPPKKRKATNTVRREEAETLRKEITVLQDQVQQLQAQEELTAVTPKYHLQLLAHSLRTKICAGRAGPGPKIGLCRRSV